MYLLRKVLVYIVILTIVLGNFGATVYASNIENDKFAGLEKIEIEETPQNQDDITGLIESNNIKPEFESTALTKPIFTESFDTSNQIMVEADYESLSLPSVSITNITDCVKNPSEPILYITSKQNRLVYAYNYETGITQTLSFALVPESITFANDEVYVALLKGQHSTQWWKENQYGAIAIIDAQSFTLTVQFDIDVDPWDIEVGDDNVIYVSPGSGQFGYLSSYSRNTLNSISMSYVYDRSIIKYNATLNRIYSISTNVSPLDIFTFELLNGVFLNTFLGTDSPYHGDYDLTEDIEISPDGKYIFNGSGNVFFCSDDSNENMYFFNNLGVTFTDCTFDLNHNLFYLLTDNHTILKYQYSTFTLLETYHYTDEIIRLFEDNGEVVALTKNSQNEYIAKPGFTTESITLNSTSLEIGQSQKLHPTYTPSTLTNTQNISWESSAPAVAYVNQGGIIVGLSVGTATITVTSVDNPDINAECTVTVTEATKFAKNRNYAEDAFWGSILVNNTKVVVGTDGIIMTAASGTNSLNRVESTTLNSLYGIASNGSKFVVVGENGTILTSNNALDWSQVSSGESSRLNDVIWDGTQFIAVGENGAIGFSATGESWSGGYLQDVELEGIVYNGSEYLTVGSDGATYISEDAHDWYIVDTSSNIYTYEVIWTGQKFIAVGHDNLNALLRVSSDGINWTTLVIQDCKSLYDVSFNGSSFVAVGYNGSILTSLNGNEWSGADSNTIASLFTVFWDGEKYCAFGEAGSVVNSQMSITSWSNAPTGASFYNELLYTNNRYIAVGGLVNLGTGDINSRAMYSEDGLHWITSNNYSGGYLNSVAWNGSLYVAVGRNGTILTTTNGYTWTKRTSGTSLHLNGVAWNGSKFVAVGDGEILISSDGTTWNAYMGGWYNDLVWTGTQFIAVGPNGTIDKSSDGIHWTAVETNTDNDLWNIATGNNLIVAVGDAGTVLTSTDGLQWQARDVGITTDFLHISWDSQKFNVLDNFSNLLTSVDAQDWKLTMLPSSNFIVGVAPMGNSYLAVGDYGTILNGYKGIPNVTQMNMNPTTLSLKVGDINQVDASVLPYYAINKNIVWTSSDTTVASVDQTGKVTALKVGTTTVKATSQSDPSIFNNCSVTVTANTPITPPAGGGGDLPPPPPIIIPPFLPGGIVPPVAPEGTQITEDDFKSTNDSGQVEIQISNDKADQPIVFDSSLLEKMNKDNMDVVIKQKDVSLTFPADAIGGSLIELAGADAKLSLQMNNLVDDEVAEQLQTAESNDGKGLFSIAGMIFEFKAELVTEEKTTAVSQFEKDLTIKLSLDNADLKNIDIEKLGVYWFNEATKTWEYMGGTYDPETNTITFVTSHFSIYSVFENRKTFDDIKNHWAKVDIEIMTSKGIIKGRSQNSFDPNATITRAEFTALVIRTLNLSEEDNKNYSDKLLEDVVQGKWYYDEVNLAYNLGILPESTGLIFSPDKPITRETMAIIVTKGINLKMGNSLNIAGKNEESILKFTDISNLNAEALTSVLFASDIGLIKGRTLNTFVPNGNLTRAEAAVMIRRLMNMIREY